MQRQDFTAVVNDIVSEAINRAKKIKVVTGVFQGLLSSLLASKIFQLKEPLKNKSLSDNSQKPSVFSEARSAKLTATPISSSYEEIMNNNLNIHAGIQNMVNAMSPTLIDELHALQSKDIQFLQKFLQNKGEDSLKKLANFVLQNEFSANAELINNATIDFVNLVKERKGDSLRKSI